MTSYKTTILVTGGTTGLGLNAAIQMAQQVPESLVLICSRSKGDDAEKAMAQHQNIKHLRLDLGSLDQVRGFASAFADGAYPPISALLMNAGLQIVSGISFTPDGIESTFGINHAGHALLFYLLIPCLTSDARIVLTGSGTHDPAQKTNIPVPVYESAELLAHPDDVSKQYAGEQRYSTSKLCNILWMYALDRHRADKNLHWSVCAFDPGLMPGTGLAREYGAVARFVWCQVLPRVIPLLRVLISSNIHTMEESGAALAHLALSDDASGTSGRYFEGLKPIDSSQDSYDRQKQDDLWEWTANFLGCTAEEKTAFARLDCNPGGAGTGV